MVPSDSVLLQWNSQRIDAACSASYAEYERALKQHYRQYFGANPHLRCVKHDYSAVSIAAALPPEWSHLQHLIPRHLLHRFARSGRSSQMLALAILGSAAQRDKSLSSFWHALALDTPTSDAQDSLIAFEYELNPSDLGEVPRVTTVDFLAQTQASIAVVECKWSERGFGICSCVKDGDGRPVAGYDCASRVNGRSVYWQTAFQAFGLPPYRVRHIPCSLSVAYQIIRSVAAARFLSAGRTPVFVLLYDEKNPYFHECGEWPGWPKLLRETIRKDSGVLFKAISWQRLLRSLYIPDKVRDWLTDKHRLT